MAKAPKALEIVFENPDFLVVNKPAGVASLDEHVYTVPSMLRRIKHLYPEAQLCHRLDKDTSGCLLVSKHNEAYKYAAALFEKRKIEKRYYAIVNGVHHFERLEVNLPLFLSNKRVKVSHSSGKQAVTFFTTEEVFRHFTLVKCEPITGRLHQIRVHLFTQNAPIINDTLYSGKPPMMSDIKRHFRLSKQEEKEEPIISSIGLHAASLRFEGMDGQIIEAHAPLRKEMEALLNILRKYDKS